MAIFEIGALGFWILSCVMSIVIICLLTAPDNPKYGWSTIFVIGTFVLLYYFGGRGGLSDLVIWLRNYPFQFIGLLILYIFIGVLWSFAEWFWFVQKMATKAKDSSSSSISYYKPQIGHEKERIFAWIFYWPWVMLWKGIHKPFTRIFNVIYLYTEKTYEQMTQNAFKKLEEERKNK